MPLKDIIQQRQGISTGTQNMGLAGLLAKREQEKGFLGKLGTVGKKTGKFLGDVTGITGIAKVSKEALTTQKPLKELIPQAIGSAAKLGLTAATFGSGIPATFGGRVALGGLEGAGFGLAESIEKGKGVKETIKQTATGAVLGMALPITFEGIKYGQRVILPKISRQLERINLRLTPVQKRNLGGKLDDVANFLR